MYRRRVLLLLLLIAAAISSCGIEGRRYHRTYEFEFSLGEGGDADKHAVAQIPFRLIDDHIVIPITVNGAGEVDMVLDTGWGSPGAILLSPELGERLGLEFATVIDLGGGGGEAASRTAGVAVGGTLAISGLEFTNQNILVVQQDDLFGDSYAEGVIGATLFDYVVEIDYQDRVLNLYEELPGDPGDYGHSFALDYSYGVPVMDASIMTAGGRTVPVTLLVDTGVNEPLLVFSFSDDRLTAKGRTIEGTEGIVSEGMTGEILGSTGRIRTLKVGPYVVNDVVASYPREESWGAAIQLGQNGMLGNEVLQRFDVVFDYGENRMFLNPVSGYARPFEYNMAGLIMRGEKTAYKILDVITDSPAWEEGIRGGDRVVELDGRAIDDYDSSEIGRMFTKPGKTLELTIERDGEQFERSVTLRRLI
jgi:hypothetical protein